MLKIGITGNIGSGKSTVCRIFKSLQIPVFYADIEARMLYYDDDIVKGVEALFGKSVFTDGEVDTKKLAKVIFSDSKALEKINKLMHPAVLKRYEIWLEAHNQAPYTLHEAAVLFEHNLQHHFHKTICVTAPAEIRLKRVLARDNTTEEEVKKRMEKQWPEEKKVALADYIIINDGNHFLIPQVMEIHSLLVKESNLKRKEKKRINNEFRP